MEASVVYGLGLDMVGHNVMADGDGFIYWRDP